ncbi:MAG: lipoate--protein ligase family protein [Microcoleus sp. SIO2G3]|nr:lipoate--protein ligase family protein [Microcoleus sp. SIO2G3]
MTNRYSPNLPLANLHEWRSIPLLCASGSVQMAIDAWLFDQYGQGKIPPVLRFYTWEPAAISLGYHQSRYPAKWRDLTWQGRSIDLVRRPSGGRAVLHQGDLTYAVITSGSGDRMQDYRSICEFLIQGWRSLHVDLDFGSAGRGYIHNPNCFGTATVADLVLPDGTKLIGSAQLRRGSAILQHGSIRLNPDRALVQQVFGAVDAIEQLPRSIALTDIIAALETAAESCFEMKLKCEELSDRAWQQIRQDAIAQRSRNGIAPPA